MARGHRLNTSIVLAAVHGLSGLYRAVSAVEPSLFPSPPPPPPPPVPVPNKPSRFCGRKAKCTQSARNLLYDPRPKCCSSAASSVILYFASSPPPSPLPFFSSFFLCEVVWLSVVVVCWGFGFFVVVVAAVFVFVIVVVCFFNTDFPLFRLLLCE